MRKKLGAVLLLAAGICSAAPITYTITGNLSGTLGTANLSSSPFRFVFNADTANIFNDNPLLNPDLTNSIWIGGNAGQFSQIVDVGVSPTNGIGGFSHPITALGITFANPGFFDYRLSNAMGPISATTAYAANGKFSTTLGALSITGATDLTFTATLADPAPEPSSILLALTGLLVVNRLRVRGRRSS